MEEEGSWHGRAHAKRNNLTAGKHLHTLCKKSIIHSHQLFFSGHTKQPSHDTSEDVRESPTDDGESMFNQQKQTAFMRARGCIAYSPSEPLCTTSSRDNSTRRGHLSAFSPKCNQQTAFKFNARARGCIASRRTVHWLTGHQKNIDY